MSNYSDYIKSVKENEVKRFFGEVKKVSNKYFTFKRFKNEDEVIVVTNNIKMIKDSFVLIVGEKQAVYLKDWNVCEVRNYDLGIEAYAVKLNRKYFKIYNFKTVIDNELSFDKDCESFDEFINLAKLQDEENMKVAIGF